MHMFSLNYAKIDFRGVGGVILGCFLVMLETSGLCLEPLAAPRWCIWCRCSIYAIFVVSGRHARDLIPLQSDGNVLGLGGL